MKAVDEAEEALRIARSGMEGDGHKGDWELVHDASGYVFRYRAQRPDNASARKRFAEAEAFHDIPRQSDADEIASIGSLHAAATDLEATAVFGSRPANGLG
jgi:hypothetical protein